MTFNKAVWFLCVALAQSSPAVSQEVKVNASIAPKTINAVGNTDAVYPPTRWPMFGASVSNNEACAEWLRTSLSGRYRYETHPRYYSKPVPQTILSKPVSMTALGLSAYLRTARILVSWTVRVEAYQSVVNPGLDLRPPCSPWNATIEEDFPGGDVETMLNINGKQIGNTATMSIPPLGALSNTNVEVVSDPTVTNSVTLTAADFGGQFPDNFIINVQWLNRTVGASIKTPAYMRNMTLFILPVGN